MLCFSCGAIAAIVRASDYKYACQFSSSSYVAQTVSLRPQVNIWATSMNQKYDCIVIGGGHNGLVNAAYLARAGKRVLVLERRHVLGGAAVTEEVFPGFKFSVC